MDYSCATGNRNVVYFINNKNEIVPVYVPPQTHGIITEIHQSSSSSRYVQSQVSYVNMDGRAIITKYRIV